KPASSSADCTVASHDRHIPLAVSAGDPSGIGIEIAVAAWTRRQADAIPPFYLLADPAVVASRAHAVGANVTLKQATPEQAAGVFADALPVVPLTARFTDRPGVADAANAAGIVEAIDRAVADCLSGRAAA